MAGGAAEALPAHRRDHQPRPRAPERQLRHDRAPDGGQARRLRRAATTSSSASARRSLRLASAQRVKQDAERAHLQSFVDRFRATASKASQAQSRIKRLAKLEPVSTPVDERVAPFPPPLPRARPRPAARAAGGRQRRLRRRADPLAHHLAARHRRPHRPPGRERLGQVHLRQAAGRRPGAALRSSGARPASACGLVPPAPDRGSRPRRDPARHHPPPASRARARRSAARACRSSAWARPSRRPPPPSSPAESAHGCSSTSWPWTGRTC